MSNQHDHVNSKSACPLMNKTPGFSMYYAYFLRLIIVSTHAYNKTKFNHLGKIVTIFVLIILMPLERTCFEHKFITLPLSTLLDPVRRRPQTFPGWEALSDSPRGKFWDTCQWSRSQDSPHIQTRQRGARHRVIIINKNHRKTISLLKINLMY